MTAPLWERLPAGLQELEQWCIAAPDKSPFTTTGHRASVTDAEHYTDFYSACTVARSWGNGAGIGFVLVEGDGVACIDLDVKDADNEPDSSKWTTQEQLDRYQRIIDTFDSYTERSRSGKGIHIWVRGVVGAGARRDGVEVYSQDRFMICTGDVVNDKPLEHRQEILDLLVADIRRAQDGGTGCKFRLVEALETESDQTIYERAERAGNGAKFSRLWQGQWQGEAEYPSQSEADLSLLSMLTFYSKSNEQVRRLFRMSALGQRPKATKNDKYLNRTLVVIRGRQDREAKVEALGAVAAIQLVERMTAAPLMIPVASKRVELEWPPGKVGEIAQYLYSIAPRPVREVSVITALGILAGFLGRSHNISNAGLNLYLVLVARSAIGKEAIHSGASAIINGCLSANSPGFSEYIDFTQYASGPAVTKALMGKTSFLNIAGEWGRKLKKMADDQVEGPMNSLRTALTELYHKSGAGTIVGGLGYSDKEKNIASVDGVAYSMLGETTPANFYEALTNTMLQDGFMSRFIVIEYSGLRPELNMVQNAKPPEWITNWVNNVMGFQPSIPPGCAVNVQQDAEATALLEAFNKECDSHINGTLDESHRQMWNRAHLKALKVAALLASADNYLQPVVDTHHAQWALSLIRKDISIMSRKMSEGDVGSGDSAKERKLLMLLAEYLRETVPPGYKVPDAMRLAGVVPRRYLQTRVQGINAFENGRMGRTKELDIAIKSLCDSGYLAEVSRDQIPVDWGSVGRCFRVLTLPDVV